MSVHAILLACLFAVGFTINEEAAFKNFKVVHARNYTGSEESLRFGIFSRNLRAIQEHNEQYKNGEYSFWLGVNKFADLTNEEYQRRHLNLKPTGLPRNALGTFVMPTGEVAPDSWDWRTKGVVTHVKNQGQCGSCWAFSAVAAMESRYALDGGKLTAFSEQELVDCVDKGKDNCQKGGEMHDGVEEIVKDHHSKINTEVQYPYKDGTSPHKEACKKLDSVAIQTKFTGYVNVTSGNEAALQNATYTKGVISVGIDASEFKFQMYAGGVYVNRLCKKKWDQLDHGVSVVGYGEEKTHNGEPYWIVKNSWGASWGKKGYIWMAKDHDNMCGIATDAIFVVSGATPTR